jgi:hypothetical protein
VLDLLRGFDLGLQRSLVGCGDLCAGFFTNGNHNLYRGYHSYRCGPVIKTSW